MSLSAFVLSTKCSSTSRGVNPRLPYKVRYAANPSKKLLKGAFLFYFHVEAKAFLYCLEVTFMSEIGLRTKMLVRDIMSSPVVTIDEDEATNRAASNMDMKDLGAVIVQNKAGKSIGIITERDLVKRVVAKNLKPDTIKAKEIMTTPLVTIEPEASIIDAARRMTRLGHQKTRRSIQRQLSRHHIKQRRPRRHAGIAGNLSGTLKNRRRRHRRRNRRGTAFRLLRQMQHLL